MRAQDDPTGEAARESAPARGTPPDPGRQPQRDELSRATRQEHDATLAAMHCLEAALASPAPGRELAWLGRARRELGGVAEALERHVRSAGEEEGLHAELDLTRPSLVDQVEGLRVEGRRLMRRARELEREAASDAQPDVAAFRRRASELLEAIRRHHAEEVDLLFEIFWTDIGVGD